MRLFIDASVGLASAGQRTGASRAIFDGVQQAGWELLCSQYVLREIAANLGRFPPAAAQEWPGLAPRLTIVRDLTSFDYPVVFPVSKDRPHFCSGAFVRPTMPRERDCAELTLEPLGGIIPP